jgi:hypothetical protein
MTTRGPKAALAFSALLLGSQAFAASIQARIPFEFLIGDRVLPPAVYIVETAGTTGPSVLVIRDAKNGARLMLDTKQMPEMEDPKLVELVFDTVGNRTYLTEVWGVTDSGRAVKHLVDGETLTPSSAASRQRITALRIVDGRTSGG